ncbi:toxin-antitoxin system YwqK family antitoxin [Psychrilyobacter piezotolerans]|uniref:Toxin-antitoxin system YwqK family antitoxin n=2 Tax=Psychrilyobacter TaxID=623282 RepID=A0ABX9KHD5_9FUSO|nr:toxin-antitoxin system YwqK family antitoxin [Psychrilyobacter sp. S5]REI41419.1 toxin-antitoxin system YwqK family antitoxin [Psychrilyobacter piezotolerans]
MSIRTVSSYFAISNFPYIKMRKINFNLILTYLILRYIILIEEDYKGSGRVKKRLLVVFILCLILISCDKREELFSKTQKRNGLIYITNEKKPYTGILLKYYKNGQIKEKLNFEQGKYHGENISYYEDGQIKEKFNFEHDQLDGEMISYYKNGQVEARFNFKQGKQDGENFSYYKNGQVEMKLDFKQNQLDGKMISYYENGQIKDEINWQEW